MPISIEGTREIMKVRRRAFSAGIMAAATVLVLAGCSNSSPASEGSSSSGAATGNPVTVGVLASLTGPLAIYGPGYVEGVQLGLSYATNGTNVVNGHPVNLKVIDDGTDPSKAVAAATDLVGNGSTIIAGTNSSGVGLSVAAFAAENNVLFITGGATSDAITGLNRNTFRAIRGTYQDIANIAASQKTPPKNVVVLAPDTAYGKDSAASATTVFEKLGSTVRTLSAPEAGTDFTTFAKQILDIHPAFVYVAWANPTYLAGVMQALQQQGILDSDIKVSAPIGGKENWSQFPDDASKITLGAPFIPGYGVGPAGEALKKGTQLSVHSAAGFQTGQMIVRALTEGSADDTQSMIKALEGWTFDSPKGPTVIRAQDHASIEPMYIVSLKGTRVDRTLDVISTTPADSIAPPVKSSPWAK